MKTLQILITAALFITTFNACKKEELNMNSTDVTLERKSENRASLENNPDIQNGMIKIIFNEVGTMIIEGNPNLENLITMYNATATAITSAKEVFETTEQESLSITFDKYGIAIASEIPRVLVGSTIDSFIFDYCKVKPDSPMMLEITKNSLNRNHEEIWNAMPQGFNQDFASAIENLQNELPLNYSLRITLAENQNPSVVYLDENGDPQPLQNSNQNCKGNFTPSFSMSTIYCAVAYFGW